MVQRAGRAFRLRAEVLRWECDQSSALRRLVMRDAQWKLLQVTQTAICNRFHTVEQQLSRWLLSCFDHRADQPINLTQLQIAGALGVRREAVTEAAGKLQRAGLIDYHRGHITLLDRDRLVEQACECYAVVKDAAPYSAVAKNLPHAPSRPFTAPENLRQRAEQQLARQQPPAPAASSEMDQVVRELQVHQIELELRNDELLKLYDEAEALRHQLADVYNFAPVAYVIIDHFSAIQHANLAGAMLLGIKGSEIARHRFSAFISPACVATFNQFLIDVLAGQARQRCEIELSPTPQRGPAIVQIAAVTDEQGQQCRMVVHDVTLQRQNERALREREQTLRALLDNFPFMVWMKDEQGRFLAVNKVFAEACGRGDPEAVAGLTDLEVWPREFAEQYRADDQIILAGGQPRIFEEWIEEGDEQRWNETFKAPIILDGRVIGTVGFARDITERKAAEAESARYQDHLETLVQARVHELAMARDEAESANRAKSAFLGNMSHELRTPLNHIVGCATILRRETLSERGVEFLTLLEQSSQLLLQQINRLIDMARGESGRLEMQCIDFELSHILDQVEQTVMGDALAKGLTVVRAVSPGVPTRLQGDPVRLSQVLTNLLDNAIKFSSHGSVVVRVSAGEPFAAQLPVRFAVEDQGIGVNAAIVPGLFKLFTQGDDSSTRRYGGFGLGLALSRRLVTLMAGEIGFTSVPDHGSTFWFSVPLGTGAPQAVIPSPVQPEAPGVAEQAAQFAERIAGNRPSVRLVSSLRAIARSDDPGTLDGQVSRATDQAHFG